MPSVTVHACCNIHKSAVCTISIVSMYYYVCVWLCMLIDAHCANKFHCPLPTGLQLKIKNRLLKAFTYALAPDTESINPVKRKVLVTDNEIEGDHVLVHKLEPSQKLSEVVAGYRKHKYTKAVVVVNTASSLMLEPAYLEGFEGGTFPVLVVSQADGRELVDIIEEEEDVLCDIEVESAVDAPSQQNQLQAVTEQPRPGGAKGAQENKTTGMAYQSIYPGC